MCFSLKGWMKCRNWRPENPERPGTSGISGISGSSGSLRKRPVRATPENPEPPKIPSASSPARKYMLFAPKPQALRRFICPATAHLRTKCRTPLHCGPQNTPAPHHNPFPCVSLRNRPKAAPENPEPPEHPEPSGTLRHLHPLRTHHTDYLQSHILQFKTQHTYFNYKQ